MKFHPIIHFNRKDWAFASFGFFGIGSLAMMGISILVGWYLPVDLALASTNRGLSSVFFLLFLICVVGVLTTLERNKNET